MKAEYRPYQPKRILNCHKHTDGPWFWLRYTAYPYIGCEHACEYCYTVMDKYCHFDEPEDFYRIIKVKTNAAELLRKELEGPKTVEGIGIGDYQPAEEKFELSRKMLMVVRDAGWPILLLEKSDLVLRDLDLFREIKAQSEITVAFSIISTNDALIEKIEPRATPPSKRFVAMRKLADAGINTGTYLIPVLPGITDDDQTLRSVVKATADAGGSFVLPGGLTLNDNCGIRFRKFIHSKFPHLEEMYHHYSWSGQKHLDSWVPIAKKVTKFCDDYGIRDSNKRYIPENKFKYNKLVSEILFRVTHLMENLGESNYRVWAFRKAAWAVDELEVDVRTVYETGTLSQIQNIGSSTIKVIIEILETGESTLYNDLQRRWRL